MQYWTNIPYAQPYQAEAMAESLLSRFKEAKLKQEAVRSLGTINAPAYPTGAVKQTQGGLPPAMSTSPKSGSSAEPPPVPISPLPPGEMKAAGGLVPQQLETYSRQREYAHQNSRKGNDSQDTVFWHPALVTNGGEVQVTFDLSSVPTSYRVLLYGHTADGRLGGFQGRLTDAPARPNPSEKTLMFTQELEAAREAGRRAGDALRRLYTEFRAIPDAPASISTEADRQSQEIILQFLRQRFPGDALCAEEQTGTLAAADHTGTDCGSWTPLTARAASPARTANSA